MTITDTSVPEDLQRQGVDVLNGRIGTRTNCIHEAMARSEIPLAPIGIGELAQEIAESLGLEFNDRTYSEQITYNHLNTMRTRQYAERLPDGRWQLTEKARQLIERARQKLSSVNAHDSNSSDTDDTLTPRKTDRQARLTLPDDFANTQVILERISDQELRIRKAHVRPKLFNLADLLSKVTDENRHAEISTGPAVGREAKR